MTNLQKLNDGVAEGDSALIVDPISNNIVSASRDEHNQLVLDGNGQDGRNPLQTKVLLAIQGVARKERLAAMAAGGVSTESFATGQYLCTGYDLYVHKEPDMYEAMALLHSRVRRIVFVEGDERAGGLGGGTDRSRAVHSLRNTNHHYRVFKRRKEVGKGKREE